MGDHRRRATAFLAVAASIALLAGCGTQVGGGSGGPTVAVTQDRFGSCPKELPEVPSTDGVGPGMWWLDGAPIGSLVPVAVVLCEQLGRDVGGLWQTYGMREKRYDDGFDALVAALRLPDTESQSSEVFCTTELPIMDTFVLVAADGSSVLPRTPQDECDKPLAEVWSALEALRASTPDDETTYETEPTPGDDVVERAQDAQTAGCPDVSKNMAVIDAQGGARGEEPERFTADDVRLCLMAPGGGEPQEPLVGFVGGAELTGVEVEAVNDALGTAVPELPACDQEPAEIVILSPVGGGSPVVFAELGGCGRLSAGGFVGTASPELLEVLTTYADLARPKK